MMQKFTEKPIKEEFVMQPGTYFLSVGGTQIYKTLSYPCCRLYHQHINDPDLSEGMKNRLKFSADGWAMTPNLNESGWKQCEDGEWRKDRNGNFPSYLCSLVIDGFECPPSYVTIRSWNLIKGNLAEVQQIAYQKSEEYRMNEVHTQIPDTVLELIKLKMSLAI